MKMKPKLSTTSMALLMSTFLSTTTALSLQNFQAVSITAVPLTCLTAYDTTITDCNIADFATGNTCSSTCVSALTSLQSKINTACDGTQVSASTLLGMIFNGNLVNAICELASTSGAVTTSIISTSSQVSIISTATSISTTAATASIKETTTSQSTSTRTTTTTINSISTISSTLSTFTSTVSSTISSASSISTPESIKSSSSDTTASSTSTSTTKAQATASKTSHLTPEQSAQLNAMQFSGGGSPFDIVDSGSERKSITKEACLLIGIGWAGLWGVLGLL